MILEVGHASYRGRVHEYNSDYSAVTQHWVTDAQLAEKGPLFVLADEIGGEQPGESSRHAVNRLYQLYYTYPSNDIRQSLRHALNRLNNEIYEEARRHQAEKCVTLLAAVVKKSTLYLANVGQVRAYSYRQGRLQQVTADHPREELLPHGQGGTELVKEGTEEAQSPTRSLGSSRYLLIDWVKRRFSVGDILLLCTDGLYQIVSNGEMQQAISENPKMQAAADRLVSLAGQHESQDSATAIVISAMGAARTPKEAGGRITTPLASWLFWVIVGIALVAAIFSLATWKGFSLFTQPTASPTATRAVRTYTPPLILRPTSTPYPTVTMPPTATVQPTATEKPAMIEPQPTATLPAPTATSTPLLILYNAPSLIAPHNDEAVYPGENNVMIWQWYRQLGAGELFEIRLWKEGVEPPTRGTMQVPSTQFRFGVPLDQTGKYYWSVTVVRSNADGGIVVSLPSETRFFWWMSSRSQPTLPTFTPAPPTNTPVPPTSTLPPTSTPRPPTNTPLPPTNTPLPPTSTPLPPTSTRPPTNTPPTPTPLP